MSKENMPSEAGKGSRDEALFEALGKSRKQKRRRIIRIVIGIILLVAVVLVCVVSVLRRNVQDRFGSSYDEVKSYQATVGSISTVVSGSGTLTNVDMESVALPVGVELKDVLVEYGDAVAQKQLLATVDMATVRSAMSGLQTQIEDLDKQLVAAEDDQVSNQITAGVSGRVKIIYAKKGDEVTSVMVQNGSLAVISLDGFMAMELETDALEAGDKVTVAYGQNKEASGTVESVTAGVATILVTDNGPAFDEEVTVFLEDGTSLGAAKLYIHNPLAVTGFAGTVSGISVRENQKVSASTTLFHLKDTGYSANYDSLLRQRGELEEQLLTLLEIQKYGGIVSPISGSVYSVADPDSLEPIIDVAAISPDVSVSVTITVDESDILSLELDQQADVVVNSVSDEVFVGTVTEIDKSASVGYYTAVVTLNKEAGMLPGMTADVDIKIEGVAGAVLIPVEALNQTSTGYYVYTSYDTEAKVYGDRTDVTVGLSNDQFVEIKSGLQAGDTVYYTEVFSIYDFFNNMNGMNGSGGPRPGGHGG